LLPSNRDIWWDFNNQTNENQLCEEIMNLIVSFVLPAMYDQMKHC